MTASEHLLGITGMTPGGLGVWLLVAIATGSLALLRVLVQALPEIRRSMTEAKVAERNEKRTDGDWVIDRMEAMEKRLDTAEQRATELDRKFTLSLAAYRIVVSELHRINPKSAVISQAQRLLGPDMMADLPEVPVEPVGASPE